MLRDHAGVPRILADRSTTEGLVDAAFDALREAASRFPAVLIRLADMLGQLAPSLRRRDDVVAVLGQLDKVAGTTEASGLPPADRQAILRRVAEARGAVEKRILGGAG